MRFYLYLPTGGPVSVPANNAAIENRYATRRRPVTVNSTERSYANLVMGMYKICIIIIVAPRNVIQNTVVYSLSTYTV